MLQCRFIASHQHLFELRTGGRLLLTSYSLPANAIHTPQIYGGTAIKSGCVITWKEIMLRWSQMEWVLMQNNKPILPRIVQQQYLGLPCNLIADKLKRQWLCSYCVFC